MSEWEPQMPEVLVFFMYCNQCDTYGAQTDDMERAIREADMHQAETGHNDVHAYSNVRDSSGGWTRIS